MESDNGIIVSIILSTYGNSSGVLDIIGETPISAWKWVEYIVLDDGSEERHQRRLIENYSAHPSVKLILNEKNLGVLESQKRGVRVASGKFLLFRGDDDRNLSKLWNLIEDLLVDCDAALITGAIEKERNRNLFLEEPFEEYSHELHAMDPMEFVQNSCERPLWAQATFFRKDVFDKFGGFDSSLLWLADSVLIVSIAFEYGLIYCGYPLARVSINRESFSAKGISDMSQNNPAYLNLIRVLANVSSDLASKFALSGWLGRFGSTPAKVYYSHPDLWSERSSTMLGRCIHYLQMERDQSMRTIGDGKKITDQLKTLAFDVNMRLGIFGCGLVASILLRDNGIPGKLVCFISSDADRRPIQYMGYPVYHPNHIKRGSLDKVIIASKTFQEEMKEACLSFIELKNVITFF